MGYSFGTGGLIYFGNMAYGRVGLAYGRSLVRMESGGRGGINFYYSLFLKN
jgi:hypothetical protein